MDETPEPSISWGIKEIEFDEMWHILSKKVKKYVLSKLWIVAVGEALPWVTGGRDATTFSRLYDKVKYLKQVTFSPIMVRSLPQFYQKTGV